MKYFLKLCFILACFSMQAQTITRLYMVGSAVPGGIQEMAAFPNNQFKYAGTLQEGTLMIRNYEEHKSLARYLTPTYEDSYVVNNSLPFILGRDTTVSKWVVPVTENRYRITVDMTAKTLKGELFTPWNELFIVGGATECGWVTYTFLPFTRDSEEICAWDWTGELRERSEYAEPRRFKFNGQNAWEPKVLHPYTSDEDVLKSTQLFIGGSIDRKWSLTKEGIYHIRVDVFRETVKAEYLGNSVNDSFTPTSLSTVEGDTPIMRVQGRVVEIESHEPCSVSVSTFSGQPVFAAQGATVHFVFPNPGGYIVHIKSAFGNFTTKIVCK